MLKTNTLASDDIDVATLNLSGERVVVGYSGSVEPSVVLQLDHDEPIYFTPTEAHLLIAGLNTAIERSGEAK